MDRRLGGARTGAMRVREQQLLLRWRCEAAGSVRPALAAARGWFVCPPSARSSVRAIILLVGLAVTSRAAFAVEDTITVTTLVDKNTGKEDCSLREAITNINNQAQTNTNCTTGTGRNIIDFSVKGTISITLGVLSIGGQEASLTINGGNAITLDGGGSNQIFGVRTLTYLNDLTISNGFATTGGAATVAGGALKVTNCSFVGNKASDLGGAIFMNYGASVQLTKSIFVKNVADNGGAVFNAGEAGQLLVSTTTFDSNRALESGGAIYGGSNVLIDHSTFQNNTGSAEGGAIYNAESLNVTASTFFYNVSGTRGGAIGNGPLGSSAITNSTFAVNSSNQGGATYNSGGEVILHFCTFSFNSAPSSGGGGNIYDESSRPNGTAVSASVLDHGIGHNCSAASGRISDGGNNISSDKTCGFTGTGARGQALGDGVDPMLDPAGLKNNGGPTQTIAEQPNSPGVDAVWPTSCDIHTDQRGEFRPDPEDGAGVHLCDVGAYELPEGPPTATATITSTPTVTPTPIPCVESSACGTGTCFTDASCIGKAVGDTCGPGVQCYAACAISAPGTPVCCGCGLTPTPSPTGTFTRTPSATPSKTPSRTATGARSGTPTATPTPSPTRRGCSSAPSSRKSLAANAACTGDCNGGGSVTIDGLLLGVTIELGNATLDVCPAFDCNGNGAVTIDCLVTAVINAVDGCPAC